MRGNNNEAFEVEEPNPENAYYDVWGTPIPDFINGKQQQKERTEEVKPYFYFNTSEDEEKILYENYKRINYKK